MRFLFLPLVLLSTIISGCSSIPFYQENKAYSRIFLTDYSTAWTAALEAVSQGKDLIKNHYRDTGLIESQWIENTDSKHFREVFKDEEFFLRARYKVQVQVREGKKNGEPAILVRVQKVQQLEQTFLGGWTDETSNGTEEAVYLYRIGRLIALSEYFEKLRDVKQITDNELDES